MPQNKRQPKDKRFPLVSFHHVAAHLHCRPVIHVRVLRQDVGDHIVFIHFYNTRYDKQQRPQKDTQIHAEHYPDDIFVGMVETIGYLFYLRHILHTLYHKTLAAHAERIDQENVQSQNNRKDNRKDNKNDNHRHESDNQPLKKADLHFFTCKLSVIDRLYRHLIRIGTLLNWDNTPLSGRQRAAFIGFLYSRVRPAVTDGFVKA